MLTGPDSKAEGECGLVVPDNQLITMLSGNRSRAAAAENSLPGAVLCLFETTGKCAMCLDWCIPRHNSNDSIILMGPG